MSRGHFIGLNHHRLMLADRARMTTYREAITRQIRPGMRVLDVGTGTGILAMWAAQAGAEVTAVEPHDVIGVARRVAADNGLSDRIRFVQGDVRALEGDAQFDVVVSECMGNFFVTDEMQPVMRSLPRLMAPGAFTIPRRITLHVAGAMLPFWNEIRFWKEPIGGLDYTAALDFARHAAYVVRTDEELVATDTAEVADFPLIEAPDAFELAGTLVVARPRTLHALVGWFDAHLGADVVLTTRPGVDTHWGQMAFVVPETPVVAGDRVHFRLALSMDASLRSRWRWHGTIERPGRDDVPFVSDTAQRFGGASPPSSELPPPGESP